MTPLGQFAPPEPHATDRPAGLGLPGQAVREALDSVLRRRDNDIAAFYRLARLGYWRRVVASNDITWSEEMYRIFGCDPKHKVPTYTGHKHLYTPASYAALQKAVAHAIDYGMPYEIDLEIRRPDGSTRWITAHGEAEAFEHGRASILRGTVQDITARKTAEARLALSESRYRSLVKASAVIVWITDADGAQQSTLPEWQAFTGQTDEEVKEYGWANAIHPDDYDRTLRSWRESVARGELHETEHRLRRHDGAYRCMAVRAAPVRDPSGKIVEWVGMHTDITEKKAAEAALRQAEIAALATSIVASSPFATIVAGWDGVISAVNPAAQRMLGYDKAELVGQATPLLFLHPDDLVSRAAALTDILQMPITPDLAALTAKAKLGMVEESEWRLRRSDGAWLDAHLTICPRTGANGEAAGLILFAADLTERKLSANTIAHLAHHDLLTGLANRSLLQDRLQTALARARRGATKVALLMIDLDNFKQLNDLLSHQAGDRLLMHAARCLRASVRETDTVARIGGDSFVVVLDGIGAAQDAARIGAKILKSLSAPFTLEHQTLSPRASIGICLYPDKAPTAETLFKNAEAAMHRVKSAGGNGIHLFTARMAAILSRRRQLEAALGNALEREEFQLVYQPQLSLRTGQVIGVEALLRWRNPELGLVMPGDFIPLAEADGQIGPIGAWVLRTACQQGKALQSALGRRLTIAVNVSARQFEMASLPRTVRQALANAQLDPDCLELEMTENLLISDSPTSDAVLADMRSAGVRVAIDDFGTGFCNMSYIMRFHVHRLKIDQSFVRNMASDRESSAVTAAIIGLARGLNITVLAEGIETAAQHALLHQQGCDEVQGFFYAQPAPLERMASVIRGIEARRLNCEQAS